MSMSDANKIQENSGTNDTGIVTLGGNTTAGNTLFVITYSAGTVTAPAGFSADVGAGGAGQITYWRKPPDALGAESSWTFTASGFYWYVVEYSNIDGAAPIDVSASGSNGALGNGGTLSTGTTSQNAGLSVVALASWVVDNTGSWDSQTNGFTEVADVSGTFSHMAVAELFQNGITGTFGSTATNTTGGVAAGAVSRVVVYLAADSPINAPIHSFAGFRWGTPAGMGNTTNNPVGHMAATGTYATNYDVASGYARDGGSGLKITNAGTVTLRTLNGSGFSQGFNVQPVSGSGIQIVAQVVPSSGFLLYLVYDFSTNKFGVKWDTAGTVSWQSGTTALNSYVWFEWRAKNGASGHVDWSIESVAQTSPANATLGTGNWLGMQLGDSGNGTCHFRFSDYVGTKSYVAYPLGVHTVKLLVPETTGASVSGTPTNFSEFTANGTLAAFASTSGQRIDEVPPTISASADGVVQTATAASDYMNFPMTTYTCAYDEIIAGVRALFAEWGGTGAGTGTIGYRGYDGTTETTFVAASASYDPDSLTTPSATYPLWKQAMWINSWTQDKLNNASTRAGYSTDATPDMGIHAAYLEVAIRKAPRYPVHTIEDGAMTADLYVNPYNSAAVSYVITNNDPTRTAVFNYSIAGTPQTPVTVAPGAGPTTLTLNADAFGDISETTLTA